MTSRTLMLKNSPDSGRCEKRKIVFIGWGWRKYDIQLLKMLKAEETFHNRYAVITSGRDARDCCRSFLDVLHWAPHLCFPWTHGAAVSDAVRIEDVGDVCEKQNYKFAWMGEYAVEDMNWLQKDGSNCACRWRQKPCHGMFSKPLD